MKRFLIWLFFLPFQLLLATLLALCDLARPFRAKAKRLNLAKNRAIKRDLCSIIVLNWNGRNLLQESLPALERAVEYTKKNHSILVVDNGSSDGSLAWLRHNHPHIQVLSLNKNLGFGEGNNRGVEAALHDIVVLVNNDMIVAQDFLPPLLEAFSDPQVFAVSSQILFPEDKRQEETGNTHAGFHWGRLHLSHQPIESHHYRRETLPVLWAGGGSSAFHRRRFLELGGFSSLFSPCYLEDTDLSYRAWRRGWKILLAAQSKVLHKHRSSSKFRFGEVELKEMVEQRKLWYLWKNFQLLSLVSHLLLFPFHLGADLSTRAYLGSLSQLPKILSRRSKEPSRTYSDRLLFRFFRDPLSYLNHVSRSSDWNRNPSCPPLRILFVSAYLPYFGRHGGAGRVFQLLRRVAQKHQVSLITFLETRQEMEDLTQVIPYCNRVEVVYRRQFVPVSPFPYEPFEEFNCPNFRAKLREVLLEEDFDLVHFEWTQMAQFADLVPHASTLVTEVEVNWAAHYSQARLESSPLRKLRKLYNSLQTLYRELELCRKVDKIVCVTETDADYLRGYVDPSKVCVVNTGVDPEYFTSEPPEAAEPDALVFVGAFRHEPNIDAMLYFCQKIFPLVLRERPQTRLYIVGHAPPPSILELGVTPNIIVTGFVEDIRDYYRKAQVVIVPLRTGVGIRGKILEAWAAGKPVVATSVACLGIRACHGENILIADVADQFALWTLALLRQPEYSRRLGRAGRETAVQFYAWSSLGDQLVELYESMARNDPTR